MKLSQKSAEFILALFFVLAGVILRLLPHAPNFTPIAAIALFSGVYFSRKTALILPVAAMAVSDMFLGFYDIKIMTAVYGSFILSVVLGFWLKNSKKWQTIGEAAVLSSVLFFIITNFAVWIFTPWYEKTFFGIIECYAMALPFLKNMLLGDLFYTASLFGVYELVKILIKKIFISNPRVLTFE
jgi:hypothetical protein